MVCSHSTQLHMSKSAGVIIGPMTATSSRLRSWLRTCSSMSSGAAMTSSSTKSTMVPVAVSIPVLRATAGPPFGWATKTRSVGGECSR